MKKHAIADGQQANALEACDHTRRFIDALQRANLTHADCLRLQVVVAQHGVRDVVPYVKGVTELRGDGLAQNMYLMGLPPDSGMRVLRMLEPRCGVSPHPAYPYSFF